MTALATPAQAAPVLGASISTVECAPGVVPMSSALPSQSEPVLPKRAAHYLWAVLIARIYEVFPSCVRCVAGICASSRSLRTALTSGTS